MPSPVRMTGADTLVPSTFLPEVRIAISLRLSRSDDASTSLDVQLRACKDSIRAAGHDPEMAEVFIDDGVSGATPLSDREGMSALMAYRPTHVWAWKLDRYSRSVREFLHLVEWAETPGARVILATADGSLNTGTPGGRLIALILVALAEWERQMITERILAAHKERREQGRVPAGPAPFPFKTVRADPKAPAYFEVDSKWIPLVIQQIGKLLAGGTLAGTAKPLPIGRTHWKKLLTGVLLRGWRFFKGKLVTKEDGVTPVQFAPEIIDAITHARIKERLKELAAGERAPKDNSRFLDGFASCFCTAKMIGGLSSEKKSLYKCCGHHGSIMTHLLEPKVEADFHARFGEEIVMKAIHSGGVDHSSALLDLNASKDRIVAAIASLDGPEVPELAAKLRDTIEHIERLSAEHDPEITTTYEATEMIMSELWDQSDDLVRRQLLAERGLQVTVHPATRPGGRVDIAWDREPLQKKRRTHPVAVSQRSDS